MPVTPVNINTHSYHMHKRSNSADVLPSQSVIDDMLKNLERHTLAIYKDGKIKYYNQRNLKPVFLALEDFNNNFENCFIADRRISKASAMLFAYGNAKNIITPVSLKKMHGNMVHVLKNNTKN